MTDFKSYVKTLLNEKNNEEEKKAKKAEDYEDDIDDEENSDEEDDEEEASVKTCAGRCTGSEARASVDDDDDDEDDEDDEDDDEDDDEEEKKDEPKGKSIKEQILYTSRYNTSTLTEEDLGISEEKINTAHVISESIKNNSASKYMKKLANKAEKVEAKFAKKGEKENAKTAKEAAKKLREASNELYRIETRYKEGDPTAKKEYKKICAQYSTELKNMGKGAKTFKGILGVLAAGAAIAGVAAFTGFANEDVGDRIIDGAKNGHLWDTIKSIDMKNKEAIKELANGLKDEEGVTAGIAKAAKNVKDNAWNDGYKDFGAGAAQDALSGARKLGKKAKDTIEDAGKAWGKIK